MKTMWTGEGGRRALAWLALGLIGAAYVWDCGHVLRWTSARPFPFLLVNWVFVFLPFLLNLLPLIGYWLLCDARWKGGGRWGWRWVVGAVLVGLFLKDLIEMVWLYSHAREPVFSWVSVRPYVLRVLQTISVVPIWLLCRPAMPSQSKLQRL